MIKLGFSNSVSWELAFGPLPRYKKTHDTVEAAAAEAARVAAVVRRQLRGDGRAQAIALVGGRVVGIPVRI